MKDTPWTGKINSFLIPNFHGRKYPSHLPHGRGFQAQQAQHASWARLPSTKNFSARRLLSIEGGWGRESLSLHEQQGGSWLPPFPQTVQRTNLWSSASLFHSRLQVGFDNETFCLTWKERLHVSHVMKDTPWTGKINSFLIPNFHGRKYPSHLPHGRGFQAQQAQHASWARLPSTNFFQLGGCYPRTPTNSCADGQPICLSMKKMLFHHRQGFWRHLQRRQEGKTITDINAGHFRWFPASSK